MKKIIFLLAIFSFISSVIGASLVLEFYPKYIGNIGLENIKNGTTDNISSAIKEDDYMSNLKNLKNLEDTIKSVSSGISSSVVSIIIEKDLAVYRTDPFGFFHNQVGSVRRQVGGGTGFFVTGDGIIITNKHVVSMKDASYMVITNDGTEYSANVLAIDPMTDLAVVKIVSEDGTPILNMPTVSLIDNTTDITVGQIVLAIGNTLGQFQNTVTMGLISGEDRTIETEGERLSGLVQTDAAINPGNSGGPLVNLDSKVVGINTAIAEGNNIGFAIPLSKKRIDYILDSISKYNKIRRPFLGISYIPLTPGVAKELQLSVEEGVYIPNEEGSIIAGSPAEEAGLKSGDIIVAIDSKKIDSSYTLNDIMQNKIPGDKLKLKIYRESVYKDIEIVLSDM